MLTATVLTTKDKEEWQTVLPCHVSVFGSVEYATIWEEQNGGEARLFVLESHDSTVAYPFFVRPISSLPFAVDLSPKLCDIRSPEFTGPIACKPLNSSMGIHFVETFSKYCRQEGIVAEFVHLHPWDAQLECLVPSSVEADREMVYVDLEIPEEQLWRDSLTYACRKNVRRARRAKVRVFEASTPSDVQEFYRIYIQTMDRNEALERYYFSLDFFLAFLERMPHNARFALADYQDQVVAATLYLHDQTSVYSYLGGADHAFQQVRPTNAVVYDTIRWAQSQGKKRLVLGGGYRPDDGIFRFKASFSPLRTPFQVCKFVHLPDQYSALCELRSAYYQSVVNSGDYFPPYRSTATSREQSL